MKLKLLGNKILVRHSYETVSEGGLVIPEMAQSRKLESRVILVGDGKDIHPSIKPGIQVVTSPFSGRDIVWNGERLKLICPDDIDAVLESEPVLSVVGSDAS